MSPSQSQKIPLPVDEYLPGIISALTTAGNLVLQAAPGAGKTTRVPPALLDSELSAGREVLVLEPRRLAARLAARRVAEELGEEPGGTVGYQVRFDEVSGPRTRLRFLTEGVLTRRLLADRRLERVGIVILDEFHERHLQSDLVLALLRGLQRNERPDLRIVVMSATLDAGPIADYLGAGEPLTIPGRQYDVQIEYLAESPGQPDGRLLAGQVGAALGRLIEAGLDGDVLVFLPGAAEIRRSQEACANLAARENLLVVPLHGDLSAEAQDLAVRKARQRKVILSTNVAESSVTIDGVVAVIDSGLARIAGHSPWSGVPTLEVGRISQAAAIQRAGRAGRTRPGLCLRLYTQQDYLARPAHQAAEIVREDLAEPVLALHAAGVENIADFDWFEAPPAPALGAAEVLLSRLGAIDERGGLTAIGREMLRYPVHPRQARLLVEARARGVFAAACGIAALIGERDIMARPLFGGGGVSGVVKGGGGAARHHGPSDLLERLDLLTEAGRRDLAPGVLRDLGLDPGAVQAVDRVRRQLLRLAPRGGAGDREAQADVSTDEALLMATLAGYPDRVARRRSLKDEAGDLILSSGGGATLSPRSVVRGAEYLVAVEAEERRERSGSERYLVRLASSIEPEWLIDLAADSIRESVEAKWNAKSERVEAVERLTYDQLVIDERRVADSHRPEVLEEVRKVLATAAREAGWWRFADQDDVHRFLWRIAFIGWNFPQAGMTDIGEADIDVVLGEMCDGLRNFAELRAVAGRGGLVNRLRHRLPPDQLKYLNSMAPETIDLAGRRNVRINYERDQGPWIASRLQDFFGMKEGPRIGGGRIPLVLHLLAPNQRPVQVTTDLAGFWQRTYPQVRRELSRRYPRHSWPEIKAE
jgi:ATP-dependent helicase HrpB